MKRKMVTIALIVLVLLSNLTVSSVFAAGCSHYFVGARYGGSGTAHNYVEFDVNLSANNWWVEREWWAVFPSSLWTVPSGGHARDGINGTDFNPPYSYY